MRENEGFQKEPQEFREGTLTKRKKKTKHKQWLTGERERNESNGRKKSMKKARMLEGKHRQHKTFQKRFVKKQPKKRCLCLCSESQCSFPPCRTQRHGDYEIRSEKGGKREAWSRKPESQLIRLIKREHRARGGAMKGTQSSTRQSTSFQIEGLQNKFI